MDRAFHLIGIGAVACLALIAGRGSREPVPVNGRVIPALVEMVPREERHSQAAYQSQTATRVRELVGLQSRQQMRQRAAAETPSARELLQRAKSSEWSAILSDNKPAFLILRERAAHSPTGETPCTLCDGAGYMHRCILCRDKKGKCVTCEGQGTLLSSELCPTCLGNAKCYLCFGTGKMSCPFCNDGMISTRWRMPPDQMPIE
jgi:hypothetical protein